MKIKGLLFVAFLLIRSNALLAQDYDFRILRIDKKEASEDGVLSDLFESYRYLPLESRDDALIGTVKEAESHNGKIFFFSRNSSSPIMVFSLQTGKLITMVGVKGRGPGEYIFPYDFTVGPDGGIYLLTSKRVIKHDSTGKFVEEYKLKVAPDKIISHGSNQFALATSYNQPELVMVNKNFKQIKSYFPFRLYRIGYSEILQRSKNKTYYFNRNFGQIYEIDEGNVSGFIEIQIEGSKTNRELSLEAIKDVKKEGDRLKNNAYYKILEEGLLPLLFVGNNQLFGTIISNKDRFFLRYSIDDDIYKLYDYDIIRNDLSGSHNNFYPVVFTDDGYLICIIEPYKLSKKRKHELNPALMKVMKKVNEESNPILFIGKLKDI